jgi:signal transduction histidine kinase
MSTPDFSSSKPYLLPYFDHPIFEEAWQSKENGDAFFSKAYSVAWKNSFFQHAFEHSDYKLFPDEFKEWILATEHHALTFAWSKNSAILIPSFTGIFPSESDKEILKRFARVFEQAYIRFLDLQQAEEQAHEAERQAALDRVRAEIASMRTAADLERITPLIWRELTTLGVPFFRCGVFIIDEAAEIVQVFLTTPEGKALAVLHLGFDDAPVVTSTVAHWQQGTVYTEAWDAAQMHDWTQFLQERGLIETSTRYLDDEPPPEHLALHFIPFAQGMLYVGSREPLQAEALDSVQALADAFAVAYARYEDFNKLETAKKKVEEALKELEAAKDQLVQQEKLASLGQLTAGIAHEIKNPLNFVNNFSEVSMEMIDEIKEERTKKQDARDEALVDEILADIRSNLEKVHKHGTRANGIVSSMLQHSRGGDGKMEPTDLNVLIKEYVNLAFHGMRAGKNPINVEIDLQLDDQIKEVPLVGEDVSRVILNLCNNAFDAMTEKLKAVSEQPSAYQAKLTVRTKSENGKVRIEIEDNGPGIPEDIKDKILQPFFTTKKGTEGTGLGLSITNDIIKAHGGELQVETTAGTGSTFIIQIPIV